jgi:hypothetical protein
MSYTRHNIISFKINSLSISFRNTQSCFSYQEISPRCSMPYFHYVKIDFAETGAAAWRTRNSLAA